MSSAWLVSVALAWAPEPAADPVVQIALAALEARMSAMHSLDVRYAVDWTRTRKPPHPDVKLPTAPQAFRWRSAGKRWLNERVDGSPEELRRTTFDGVKSYRLLANALPGGTPALNIGRGPPTSDYFTPALGAGFELPFLDVSLLDALQAHPTRVLGRREVTGRRLVELETEGLKVYTNPVILTALLDESRGHAMQKIRMRPDPTRPSNMAPDDPNRTEWFVEVEVTDWFTLPMADGGADFDFPKSFEWRQAHKTLIGVSIESGRINPTIAAADFTISPPDTCWVIDATGDTARTYFVGRVPIIENAIEKLAAEAKATPGAVQSDARPPASSGVAWKCGVAFSLGLLIAAAVLWLRGRAR